MALVVSFEDSSVPRLRKTICLDHFNNYVLTVNIVINPLLYSFNSIALYLLLQVSVDQIIRNILDQVSPNKEHIKLERR